jgi:DNA repair exonuclease SbcCD nuclease subunit
MAKVVFLGDTHFGVFDGRPLYHAFMERVYSEWFFPLLKELGVNKVYQFGDLYDKRKGVDSFSATESKRYFFEPAEEIEIDITALIGNHDSFFTNTIEVNSPWLLLSEFKNVNIVAAPRTVTIDSTSVDIIPWICRDNEECVMKFIENSDSEYCFGHFEIDGFAMYKGVEAHKGISRDLFKKYKKVYSGHYHTRSEDGNIMYVGTPHELTWNDWNDPRGIHVWDSDTGETTFHPCPFTLFEKIIYDEDKIDFKKKPNIDVDHFSKKYVKLIVEKRTDFKKFDLFVTALNECGLHDLKIIENLDDFENENVDIDLEKLDLDDTPTLLRNYVDGVDTDLDKNRLKRELILLYTEAKALET